MPVDESAVLAYSKELAAAAGLTDEAAIEKLKPVARQRFEDVERERGRVAAEKKRADDYYQEQLKIAASNQKIVDDSTAQVAAYEKAYGRLTPEGRAAAVQDVIDRKTFDERMGRNEGLTISLVKDVNRFGLQHFKDFGEVADLDAIEKIAVEQKLPVAKAYEAWARPQVEAKAKAATEKATADAVEAARIDERSKRGASQISDPQPKSPFMENLRKATAQPQTAKESFVSGWREAGTIAQKS